MCTVTYMPHKDGFFLTSNRDEKLLRPLALAPQLYPLHDIELLYPKDPKAGGSWITVGSNGNSGVLLNGAFSKHFHSGLYQKSRGLVLLEILISIDPRKALLQMDLSQIEPFTIILFANGELLECRWDSHKIYCKELDMTIALIWSSATLYDKTVREMREQRFTDWIASFPHPTLKNIFDFHVYAGEGSPDIDLVMNRADGMSTVSITNISYTQDSATMNHLDLRTKKQCRQNIQFSSSVIEA